MFIVPLYGLVITELYRGEDMKTRLVCVCNLHALRVLLCVCVQVEGLLLMLLLLLTTFIFSLLTCQVLLQLEHSRRSGDHTTPPPRQQVVR